MACKGCAIDQPIAPLGEAREALGEQHLRWPSLSSATLSDTSLSFTPLLPLLVQPSLGPSSLGSKEPQVHLEEGVGEASWHGHLLSRESRASM